MLKKNNHNFIYEQQQKVLFYFCSLKRLKRSNSISVTFSNIHFLRNWYVLNWNYGSTINSETRLCFESLLKQTEIAQEQSTSLNTLIYLPSYWTECSESVGYFRGCQDSNTQQWMQEDKNTGVVILCLWPMNQQNWGPGTKARYFFSVTLP